MAVPAGGFRRIAVLRLSSLGDVLLTLGAVQALREAWPAAVIEYWVKEEFAAAVQHHPAVSRVRVLERDARRLEDLVAMGHELEDHDLILDLHGSLRTQVLCFRQRGLVLRVASARLQRERWVRARWSRPEPLPHMTRRHAAVLARLGVDAVPDPRFHPGAEAEAWAQRWHHATFAGRPFIALAPGAAWATKRWPEAQWVALRARLAERGLATVVLSTAAERAAMPELAAEVVPTGAADWLVEPLPRVGAVLARAERAVTLDSGLMHLAAAVGTRVVALFGGTHPALGFTPSGAGHRVLCREERCQPCAVHGREACPLGHHRCMTQWAAAEVAAALDAPRG